MAESKAAAPIALPPGVFRLDAALDDRLRATSGAMPRDGDLAHPVGLFVAALGGAGADVSQILTMCGSSIEAGPLLAACELTFDRALQVDRTYDVSSEVAAMERKASRRFGSADHIRLRFGISAEGTRYGALELRMIVPAMPS